MFFLRLDVGIQGNIKILSLQTVKLNIYVLKSYIDKYGVPTYIFKYVDVTAFIFVITFFLNNRIAALVFMIEMSFVAYSLCQGKTRLKM
jgi:hypothetical protein